MKDIGLNYIRFLFQSNHFSEANTFVLIDAEELNPVIDTLLFTMIFYKGKSLVPCIITHSVFDLLSIFRVQSTMLQSVITSIVLCIVSIAYVLWILKKGQSTNTAKSGK